MRRTLPLSFYARPTLTVARDLLGKYLVRRQPDGQRLVGRIIETEAYVGEKDPASHARFGPTSRNTVMYGPPGYTYVYFIYGMYYLLNVITERKGFPAGVLIRAVEPIEGIPQMQRNRRKRGRRKTPLPVSQLANGPGKLCDAFGITLKFNQKSLAGPELNIEDRGGRVRPRDVQRTGRIGIVAGQEKPWRFVLRR